MTLVIESTIIAKNIIAVHTKGCGKNSIYLLLAQGTGAGKSGSNCRAKRIIHFSFV